MALDNAQFISELSITDPPGTDPLNQGDDQIRAVKRATQQSFPNVDAVVPQTAAQMAQMAIKNEANTFTQINKFTNITGLVLDSGDTVQLSFDKSTVRQWQFSVAGFNGDWDLRRYVGGVLQDAPIIVSLAAGEATFLHDASFQRTVLVGDGVESAPGYRFINQTNTGLFRPNSTTFGVSVNAAHVFSFGVGANQGLVPFGAPDGTELFPGYGFTSDNGTGMYASATSLNLAANGQTIASFTSSSDIFAADGRSWAANSARLATRPGFNFNSDSDTGFYNPAPNTIGFSVGGVSWGTFDSQAMWTANGVSVHGDGASSNTNPAFAFTNDTDTGFYRVQADVAGIAAAATLVMSFGTGGIGIVAGVPFFPSLPTSPGIGGSLWNDTTDGRTVKVA